MRCHSTPLGWTLSHLLKVCRKSNNNRGWSGRCPLRGLLSARLASGWLGWALSTLCLCTSRVWELVRVSMCLFADRLLTSESHKGKCWNTHYLRRSRTRKRINVCLSCSRVAHSNALLLRPSVHWSWRTRDVRPNSYCRQFGLLIDNKDLRREASSRNRTFKSFYRQKCASRSRRSKHSEIVNI